MCWISLSGTAVSRLYSSRTTGPRRESPSWKDRHTARDHRSV
jgi:hypothetical protein